MRNFVVALAANDNIIYMKVIKQPSEYRGTFRYKASNGISISSVDCPQLSRAGTCYVRGNERYYDNDIVYVVRHDAPRYYELIKHALGECGALVVPLLLLNEVRHA